MSTLERYFVGSRTLSNVTVMHAVARYLDAWGPQPYADLVAWLRPTGVVDGEDAALRASLEVAGLLGVFAGDGSKDDPYSLSSEIDEGAIADGRGFAQVATGAVMRTGATVLSDLAVGLAWLVNADPVSPPSARWDDDNDRALHQAPVDGAVTNAEQWRAFARWAVDLGFGVRIDTKTGRSRREPRLLPDPTRAIAGFVRTKPGTHKATDFLDLITTSFPVFAGGSIGQRLVAQGLASRAGDAMAQPTLTYALRRMERSGLLTLRRRDDATGRIRLRLGDSTSSIDEIEVAA